VKRIGITGGIGSGKSTVVKFFNELGIPVVDADLVAKQMREPGQPAHTAILQRFGTDDRSELRKILSQDPVAKRDLENILHPYIQAASELEFKLVEESSSAPFLLYEASLLIEAGRAKDFDSLIVVTAPENDRIARIQARDRTTPEAALGMIRSQITDEERLKFASFTIDNSGSLDDLRQLVRKLLDRLKQAW